MLNQIDRTVAVLGKLENEALAAWLVKVREESNSLGLAHSVAVGMLWALVRGARDCPVCMTLSDGMGRSTVTIETGGGLNSVRIFSATNPVDALIAAYEGAE